MAWLWLLELPQWCPWADEASPGEQGTSSCSPASAGAKLWSSLAFLVGPGTQAGAFSKLIVGKRMCKALGLFEGPTDPPQRWPIHSRLPGNNNQEK